MPIVTGQITRAGAVIDLLVGVSQNRQRRLESMSCEVPATIPVRAVIDTGSFITGFMPAIFDSLAITPFDTTLVVTPSTEPDKPFECGLYDVSITLVSGTTLEYLPSVHVIASADFHQKEEIQGLIGRDILDRCVFSYYGPSKMFSLAF